jgi:hypothetical protein
VLCGGAADPAQECGHGVLQKLTGTVRQPASAAGLLVPCR